MLWAAGQAQVDAHSILLTFCVFIYMSFPFGVSTAATIRVGNMVGANRPSEARLAGKLNLNLTCNLAKLLSAIPPYVSPWLILSTELT